MSKIVAARRSTHHQNTEINKRRRVPFQDLSNGSLNRELISSQQSDQSQEISSNEDHEAIEPFQYLELEIGDPSDPQDVTEYNNIIYKTMREKELKSKKIVFHQKNITLKDRNILIDTMCRFHYKLGLTTKTFYRFIGILDRYLSVENNVLSEELHLVGCTALYIASKMEDMKPAYASDLIQLSSMSFQEHDLFACEIKMINAIKFDLAFPTPMFFLTHFMKINGSTMTTFLYSRYVLEICQSSSAFFNVKGSLIACVAVMFCRILEGNTRWSPELAGYTQYSEAELLPYARKVRAIMLDNNRVETLFMKKKYGSDLFSNVAYFEVPSIN